MMRDKEKLRESLIDMMRKKLREDVKGSNKMLGKAYSVRVIDAVAGILIGEMIERDEDLEARQDERKELAEKIIKAMKDMELDVTAVRRKS